VGDRAVLACETAGVRASAKGCSGAERRVYPTPGPTKRQRFRRGRLRAGVCSPVGGSCEHRARHATRTCQADTVGKAASSSSLPLHGEPKLATAVREVALSAIKAGLSAVPMVGGSLASLLGDALQAHTDRAVRRAIELLRERLETLEGRIDLGAIDRDELAELFKSCYLVILRTHHEQKLRAAAALISNILLRSDDPERLRYTELDHFVRCVDGLSIGAFEALGHAHEIASRQSKDLEPEPFRLNFEDLRRQMTGDSSDLVMGLVGELSAMNLVHLAGVPGIRTAEYANYPIELTPLGVRFVRRLLAWPDQGTSARS